MHACMRSFFQVTPGALIESSRQGNVDRVKELLLAGAYKEERDSVRRGDNLAATHDTHYCHILVCIECLLTL